MGHGVVADLFAGLGTFAFALGGPGKVLAAEAGARATEEEAKEAFVAAGMSEVTREEYGVTVPIDRGGD